MNGGQGTWSRDRYSDSVKDVAVMVEKDIEKIYQCIEKKKICDAANMNVNLFSEQYETFAEVSEEYKRISEKLQGTVMLAPEGIHGIQVPQVKYGYKWWSYLLYDMEEIAMTYLEALVDYELVFIDSFANFDMCPIAASTGPVGTDNQLLYPPEFFRSRDPKEKENPGTVEKIRGLSYEFYGWI